VEVAALNESQCWKDAISELDRSTQT